MLDFLPCAYQSSGAIPKQLLLAKERFPNVCVYSLYPEIYHILQCHPLQTELCSNDKKALMTTHIQKWYVT